jgi:(S)-ureidoglycine aminohydrolase
MRAAHQLVHARTRVRPRYALMPLEGFPASRLPTWPDAQVRVLASPALGAGFVQYLIDLPKGKRGEFPADPNVETFFFTVSGQGTFTDGTRENAKISDGSFGLTPPGLATQIAADDALRLLILRKCYEHAPGTKLFKGVYGVEAGVPKTMWADNRHSLLQTLIPDDFAFDMAMNIFTFDPGFGLPIVETHVMEHGLLFLQGKGVYYLGDEWMEVEKDDFIWMGPYCPQSFYATGPTPARYLYYKNVNREIGLLDAS